jgi:sigma-B regulation protein RsbU (phosphoserine phosphatase)
LYDDFTRLEMFATAFLGRYAHEHRVLHYVNAGHAPVVYRPRGGPAVLLSADAPPLGMLPDAEGVVAQILGLRAGDLLVVATDGLNEARAPSGELFGYERLLELIDRTCDAPAPVIARAVLDAVFAFQAGRIQDDDQTLIVLKGVAG